MEKMHKEHEECNKELAVKKDELGTIEKSIEQKNEELKSYEEKLSSVKMDLEKCCKDLIAKNGRVRSVSHELSAKKEHLESLKKEVNVKEKEAEKVKTCVRSYHEEFELNRKSLAMVKGLISDRNDELELKQKQFEKLQGLISVCSNELGLKKKELDGTQRMLQETNDEDTEIVKAKQDQCDVTTTEIGNCSLKDKQIQELSEELEMLEKKYEELCKEAEMKPEYNQGFNVTIDGKALQIYLNEHSREFDSMRIVVSMALDHSSDPSMLVLDALQGFYPPHLKNRDDMEFEGEIVRKSCSLLLDELMKLSQEIRPHVKTEAEKIAVDWSRKLTKDAEHSLEVLCFLQLLASYELDSVVDADKLLTLLEIVKNHSTAPALFRALGFENKVSHVIRKFIQEKKLNEAIKFINEFDMAGQFKPVSLLNDFLRESKHEARKLRKENQTQEGETIATDRKLDDLKYVLRCIEENKIDYGPSIKNLEQQVTMLVIENSKRKQEAAVRDLQRLTGNKRSREE